MPKRECPFEFDFSPQTKIYVGEREICSGVLEDVYMQKVYEKTLDKLFKGANSGPSMVPEHNRFVNSPEEPESKPYKQMFLGNDGRLQMTGQLLSQPLSECNVCSAAIKLSASVICDYCDRRLCRSCTFKCIKCSDSFCRHCIFNTFDGNGDTGVCVGCVR